MKTFTRMFGFFVILILFGVLSLDLNYLVVGLVPSWYPEAIANPNEIWQLANTFENDLPKEENFDSERLTSTASGGKWNIILVDGAGIALMPPYHSGDIFLSDGFANLVVSSDPYFKDESAIQLPDQAAAEQYNNVFAVGLNPFLPTPNKNVSLEFRMKINYPLYGTTGLWVQEEGTFNGSGMMTKPFRAFGFSFVGDKSTSILSGLHYEAVVNYAAISCMSKGLGVPEGFHTYKMTWAWEGNSLQKVNYFQDGLFLGSCLINPFGPGEVQIWNDNGFVSFSTIIENSIGFLNVPDKQISTFDYIKIWEEPK